MSRRRDRTEKKAYRYIISDKDLAILTPVLLLGYPVSAKNVSASAQEERGTATYSLMLIGYDGE